MLRIEGANPAALHLKSPVYQERTPGLGSLWKVGGFPLIVRESPGKDQRPKWKRMLNQASNHPVGSAVIAGLILAAVLGGLTLGADAAHDLDPFSDSASSEGLRADWGPPRPAFSCDDGGLCRGADHVSLNSTANTPAYGDGRFFLSAKIEGEVGGVKDRLEVQPGDIVQLRIVVGNDGDPNRPHSRSLLARGLTGRVELPRDPAAEAKIVAWVAARNAVPQAVYDSLVLAAEEPFALHPLGDSAALHNSAHPRGLRLPDSFFGDGASLGYRRLDGRLDTCMCHIGYVLAKVVVADA